MHNFRDIQEKVFQDCRIIISELNSVQTKDELLSLEEKIFDLEDMIAFLRVSEKYNHEDVNDVALEGVDNQQSNIISEAREQPEIRDRYIAEDEVIFNNELNEIEDADIHHPESTEYELEEEAAFNNELNEIESGDNELFADDFNEGNEVDLPEEEVEEVQKILDNQKIEDDEPIHENDLNTALESVQEYDENRGKIVEFDLEEAEKNEKLEVLNEIAEELQQKTTAEHKFKLANIKGLKKVESLFDDDPLDQLKEEEHSAKPAGSILKTNVPTDYMEAEKPKPEFKLDLNDRLAFSKMLFGGSQVEMNETVNQLNSFATLEEAKEFLSDLYYQRKWDKVDEYAQRLWSLVESKFQ